MGTVPKKVKKITANICNFNFMWEISDWDISGNLYNNLILVHIKKRVNLLSKKKKETQTKFSYPHIKSLFCITK